MTGQAGIYYGSGTTASTYFFPTATVEAWDAYVATATLQPVFVTLANRASSASPMNSALGRALVLGGALLAALMIL
jgi:carboxypeptidase D